MRIAAFIICLPILLGARYVWAEETPDVPPSEADGNGSTAEQTQDSEEAGKEQDSEEEDIGAASEVSILDRDMRLKSDEVYIDAGDTVVWTEEGAHVRGDAYIRFSDMTLQADDVWMHMEKKALRAKGNVRLTVENEITYADELVFNFETKQGVAYGGAAYGEPWYYQGVKIVRVSERESLINNGILSTSSLKYPHTYFKASQIFVHLEQEIIAKNVVFMIGGVPLLWIPVYRRSLREKKPAPLIVKVGSDSYLGHWATFILPLRRTQRMRSILQFDWSTSRGTGQGFETTYNVRDVNLRWIVFKKPEDATAAELSDLRKKAAQVHARLRGDFDNRLILRLFLPYEIGAEDIDRARSRAQEVQDALAQGEDFGDLAGRYSSESTSAQNKGFLGYMAAGDGLLRPELEAAALSLEYGETSEQIEAEDGHYFFRVNDILETHGRIEKQTQMIHVAVEASEASRETTRNLAESLMDRANSGADFRELINEYEADPPESMLGETEEPAAHGGAAKESNLPLNQYEWGQQQELRKMQVGSVSTPIQFREGLLIVKLLGRSETPDFSALAKQLSDDEETRDNGGYLGWVGPGDLPRRVYSASRVLEQGEVSASVVETEDSFVMTKSEGRRNITGQATVSREDLRSYSRENAYKTGDQYSAYLRHQQDIPLGWEREGKRLAFWSRLDYNSRIPRTDSEGNAYIQESSEMRAFGTIVFDSAEDLYNQRELSLRSRLTVDKSFDFADGLGSTHKQPELDMSLDGQLSRIYGVRRINRTLRDLSVKWDKLNVPILKVPTFDDMDFSLNAGATNLKRDRYRFSDAIYAIRQERGLEGEQTQDVSLWTADASLNIDKDTTVTVTSTRAVTFRMYGAGRLVYNEEDQKGNQHILRGVVSGNVAANNTLARVYDISFIPGASRLRHEIAASADFDWSPSANDEAEDPDNPDPDDILLYPFGSSVYVYERKEIGMSFGSTIRVKTKLNKEFQALRFDASVSRDFTNRPYLGNRKWDFLRMELSSQPLSSGKLTTTVTSNWDPNTYSPDSAIQRDPFTMVSFSSSVRYRSGDFTKGWSVNVGTQYQRLASRSPRSAFTSFSWRPSKLFNIDVSARWEYDRDRLENPPAWRSNSIAKAIGIAHIHPYSQEIRLRRNLRDWDMRITWRRFGSLGNVRKEFTYQINLIADPTLTLGVGHDAVTNDWGFRSLPLGVPPTFTGGSLGRSRF
ncbi:MAG: peptidylprolyl isomerase [Candidatus Poribacteria bacterium]|nr:peptidylprolyl isomerase [Candidatus Poribacteria bacterium]